MRHWEAAPDNDQQPLKIAFLRNITMDPAAVYLKYFCRREGIAAQVHMGEYDNAFQDLSADDSPLFRFGPDLIILCLYKALLCSRLMDGFAGLTPAEIKQESEKLISFFRSLFIALRRHSRAPVLVHNFETPVDAALGVADYQSRAHQVNTFRRLNRQLLAAMQEFENMFVLDMDLLQSRIGSANFFDTRTWHLGRAPYSLSAAREISGEYVKFIRALYGRSKKCLVLDCDNTLWGGILGEDGMANIQIGAVWPGSGYLEFQKAVLNLYHRGVMLGLCSKNNEADVVQVLDDHPDMILKKRHFVALRINWENKAANLESIAAELNIDLESMVFVDDSAFEIGLVNTLLPQVVTLQLPQDPLHYTQFLAACGLFDTLTISSEDRLRSQMILTERKRKRAAEEMSSLSLEAYYEDLQMEVTIDYADDYSIPRISQLTQRTNQFNLTTRRYTEADIRALSTDPKTDVIGLRLKDRFGDMGVVGAGILKHANSGSLIDTFLLSCRVLGRGVEDVLLATLADIARNKGKTRLIGQYLATGKNEQVADFYSRKGFRDSGNSSTAHRYELALSRVLRAPDYFKKITQQAPGS